VRSSQHPGHRCIARRDALAGLELVMICRQVFTEFGRRSGAANGMRCHSEMSLGRFWPAKSTNCSAISREPEARAERIRISQVRSESGRDP
jgi:hypothetical protein